jgi:hypothetical protein
MKVSTESTYEVIHFWFICYRLRITKLSIRVDKTDDKDTWHIISKK